MPKYFNLIHYRSSVSELSKLSVGWNTDLEEQHIRTSQTLSFITDDLSRLGPSITTGIQEIKDGYKVSATQVQNGMLGVQHQIRDLQLSFLTQNETTRAEISR